MADLEILKLLRRESGPEGTFGQIFRYGRQICVTCEPENAIPLGNYLCNPHNGTEYQNVWQLENVPGHTAILIHNGNTVDNTKGCILVGDTYGTVNGKPAVMNSKATLDKLRFSLPRTFYLDIKI